MFSLHPSPHTYNFFPVRRTFKIYSLQLSNILVELLTTVYITNQGLIYLITGKFVLSDHLHPFDPPPKMHLWQPPICGIRNKILMNKFNQGGKRPLH